MPEYGTNLGTDPFDAEAKLPSYLFVGNYPLGRIDYLGLKATTYIWDPPSCGKDMYTAFIQVGISGGSFPAPATPFVDDGTQGYFSDDSNYPPLYPNGGVGTVTPPSQNNEFTDTAGQWWGGSIGVKGITFEVCRVCIVECCGKNILQGRGHGTPYSGYAIVSIGPCRTYTISGKGGKEELDTSNSTGANAPSSAFSSALSKAYPFRSKGDCIPQRGAWGLR